MIIAFGLVRKRHELVLDAWFPVIKPNAHNLYTRITGIVSLEKNTFTGLTTSEMMDVAALLPDDITRIEQLSMASTAPHSGYSHTTVGIMVLETIDDAVVSTSEAYLKLQLISQRYVLPHGLNLTGIFGVLPTIAWSNLGPILPQDCDSERLSAKLKGTELVISHLDKFPYLLNYHVPSGVRIASGSQVRLGAYLGEGTTIMPSGYVNFNAGTLGNAMIEGRVSAGVVVNQDSDIGGGASIMGTLSGGNNTVISVGSHCLLGANSGIGISLGDGCTVEAGLYITAGMKVLDKTSDTHSVVKASTLSGRSGLLFIKDSQTGQIICKQNPNAITLNAQLHQND